MFLVILYPGLPCKFSWSYAFQPANCTLHVKTPISSMPPKQFMWHFRREHLYDVYFRYPVHFLIFLFLVSNFRSCINMSKGSSSQYPTLVIEILSHNYVTLSSWSFLLRKQVKYASMLTWLFKILSCKTTK